METKAPETVEINGKTYSTKEIVKFDIQKIKEENIFDDYKFANYKYIHYEFSEVSQNVVIAQNFKIDNKAGIAWDGSFLLVNYFLQKYYPELKGKEDKIRILELGAGPALPGILMGLLGFETIVTDLPVIIPLIKANVGRNLDGFCSY